MLPTLESLRCECTQTAVRYSDTICPSRLRRNAPLITYQEIPETNTAIKGQLADNRQIYIEWQRRNRSLPSTTVPKTIPIFA
ncbi:hypothetical protein TcasGA2_TC001191 [Tribolium castaneum]|uniref:Uncharacterized protein n=1 Tax=Tribolium castaneum TaxID=7070 RepID=D6WAP1_TRICA|nr:hypothetical protein TcasGA2_TC001191 [Tribolium castaneum]